MTLMSFIKEHLEESLIQASRLVDQSLRLVCKHLPTTYLSSNEPAKKSAAKWKFTLVTVKVKVGLLPQ